MYVFSCIKIHDTRSFRVPNSIVCCRHRVVGVARDGTPGAYTRVVVFSNYCTQLPVGRLYAHLCFGHFHIELYKNQLIFFQFINLSHS